MAAGRRGSRQARKLRSVALTPRWLVRYSIVMSFEQALKDGDLDLARAALDELADLPDTGGLWLPECYGDLAQAYDRSGRHDDAIAAQERAIALGWGGRPDPRSDIAEFHLRAGRVEQAAAIWAELKAKDPDDVWLYNAAGLSYNEVGDHELAVAWLGEGLELAMRTEDPEGIAAQLSDVRRRSLQALGRELDDLDRRVDEFVPHWRARERKRDPRFDLDEALRDAVPPGDAPLPRPRLQEARIDCRQVSVELAGLRLKVCPWRGAHRITPRESYARSHSTPIQSRSARSSRRMSARSPA